MLYHSNDGRGPKYHRNSDVVVGLNISQVRDMCRAWRVGTHPQTSGKSSLGERKGSSVLKSMLKK